MRDMQTATTSQPLIEYFIISPHSKSYMDKDPAQLQASQETYTDKNPRHQEFSTLNRSTPLMFALRINGTYYISYEKSQLRNIILRAVAWFIVNIAIIYYLNSLPHVGDTFRDVITYGLITQNIVYVVLCFLDPGTLFEDQDDAHNEERNLCMTCSIYKLRTTKHCIWCNKCSQKYDHHCSVFGKCIAKRNLFIFYLFILLTGAEFPCLVVAIITNLFASQPA